MRGYLRNDGRKGIRNQVIAVYLVECAKHVATEIVAPYKSRGAQVIGFPGCYPNAYADRMLKALCTHPNVGAVLLCSLGCEGADRAGLAGYIAKSGRPVELAVIQETGGTLKTLDKGQQWVEAQLDVLEQMETVDMTPEELVVGTICGGSDATSGITANPAIGRAFDRLTEEGAACIFEETNELIGCEHEMARRAATPELGQEIIAAVEKAANYHMTLGHGSFAPGNAEGGLSTQEEKSLGAYCKSGSSTINGLIKPGDQPPTGGLYLLDVVPDGEPRFGFPNIADNAEIVELIACGSHVVLFSTGRGSVVGSAISPVIKVCANPDTYRRMEGDMDVNAGAILEQTASLDDVGAEIHDLVKRVASGDKSKSEALGHQEFILTYKTFEPIGPSCLPVLR